MDAHGVEVASIAAKIKQFYALKKPFRIYHGSTNSTRPSQRRADNIVDTSRLTRVISVDEQSQTALAQANVPMGALVETTLKSRLVPLVVMEFTGITVGGGFSGTSGESSSFRHGCFEMTINWIEIVLANGDTTRASKMEQPDLFWGAASGLGTLGVVTLLEVQLAPATPFVRMTYQMYSSIDDANARMQQEMTEKTADYLEGVVFSADSTMICTGLRVESVPDGQVRCRFTRKGDPWFWNHIQDVRKRLGNSNSSSESSQGSLVHDYVPLVDYLFRWDRGAFWTGQIAFRYFHVPFNRLTRRVLDRYLHTSVMYRALHASGLSTFYIAQDIGIPFAGAAEFQRWVHETLNIYPLWLCPLRIQRDSPDSNHGLHAHAGRPGAVDLVNFGIWGGAAMTASQARETNRAIEQQVQRLGGTKCLYAHTHYTEDEFWHNYDREGYDSLRNKYGATSLPSVYDKVKAPALEQELTVSAASLSTRLRVRVGTIWPVRGLYGFYKACRGGDYLLPKNSKENSATA